MRTVLTCGLTLALAACSTVSRDEAFLGVGDGAYVLVAADNMPITGSQDHSYTFQRVNLSTSSFEREFFTVTFSGMGTMSGNEFRKPETLQTTVRFGGKAAPAGDYALINHRQMTTYGTATSTNIHCYSLGAAVFRLHEGVINIVPVGPLPLVRAGDLEAQVAEVMAGYPSMTASRQMAEMVGSARFETGRWLGQQTCNTRDGFTFTPTTSAAPAN
jgi:hypothetical protein